MVVHTISVKTSTNDYNRFMVPQEIYTYIKQLESAINYEGAKEKLIQLYPDRFSKAFPQAMNE